MFHVMLQSARDTLVMQTSENCTLAEYFTVQRHCFGGANVLDLEHCFCVPHLKKTHYHRTT